MTRWWKCDLQVGTPGWGFDMPTDGRYDLGTDTGKRDFADGYMCKVAGSGVQVVALADHNTGEWIDVMVAAGKRNGVVVFPGCEITTGSGADGIHAVVIGERTRTSHDFDLLLAGPLGYDDQHPRFHELGGRCEPGSSGRTLLQVLEALPDDYLVVAPHAFGDNGIASCSTAKGDIRWKALHHPRLNAIDPGDCSHLIGDSFKDRFRRRELDHFPCLQDLAFVATSDAHDLDRLGSRFSWIRMEEPSLEALRQAFLDREARIRCDWDIRLDEYAERNPNLVRHAWIEQVLLGGSLGNSTTSLEIEFHPALNVLIGGRGSGKSTVVAAIRQIYSGFSTLPEPVRQEAEGFADAVFAHADLSASHRISNSQDEQCATWSRKAGSLTHPSDGPAVPTSFRVRVVNQKELFARVSQDQRDPLSASRSLLAFVDESLGLLRTDPLPPGSWWRRFEDASSEWMITAREHQKLKTDLDQLSSIRAQIRDLEAQIAAFDSPEARSRRERNEARISERVLLSEREHDLEELLHSVADAVAPPDATSSAPKAPEFTAIVASLDAIGAEFRGDVRRIVAETGERLDTWRTDTGETEWMRSVQTAESDEESYLAELKAKGIDPKAYGQLTARLGELLALEKTLRGNETKLGSVRARKDSAWQSVLALLQERRQQRAQLLGEVAERSGRLRFELRPHHDSTGWVTAVRELLNLRIDAFLDDVPRLSEWIWNTEEEGSRDTQWARWREALATANFDKFGARESAGLRATWQKKLESLDETLRLRLATETADDALEMQFLKDGGRADRAEDWQDITQGSPGQRTAAMLAFVLHHGDEPLVLDQPEDDLDTEWISNLVVRELRASRFKRQIIVVTHNANIPVNGDAERVVVLENHAGALRVRDTGCPGTEREPFAHCGAIEVKCVREDIQNIMEGGIRAFMQRERKYNNEVRVATGATS